MSYHDPFIEKHRAKLRKLLRTCLTPDEEREMWRYFLTQCPDDKLKASMFKTWIDRYHGPVANRNINVNANHHTHTLEQSNLPPESLALIRQALRIALPNGNQATTDQPIDAEYKVIEVPEEPAPLADPTSEQLDKLIKCKADIQRIRREMHEKSN